LPTDLRIPLARWADRQLADFARETGSGRVAALTGDGIVGERASMNGYCVPGRVSAGPGGGRLLPTRDGGWFALTLIRDVDRELLPALFGDDAIPVHDNDAIAAAVRQHDSADLLARGRELGLMVACADEVPAAPAVAVIAPGPMRTEPPRPTPLVVDLSAIWAGPLAGHLLWLAGAQVVKVESLTRPDLIRHDDPATFDRINQGKANIVVDFDSAEEKAALVALIRRANIVIESSRPRALRHLGIDADQLVRDTPGLVWLSVTGHGATGEPANWVGIGHDCGVAGGLSRALADAHGAIGFVGDALADPLTGIVTARAGWTAWRSGVGQRIGLSMSAITAKALAEERSHDQAALTAELRAWGDALGQPFPFVTPRPMLAPVSPFGADTARYLPGLTPC